MSRRRLLNEDTWTALLDPPLDDREIARHYTFTRDDLDDVTTKRSDANRLGFGIVMLYLRYPGRALEAGELPPDAVLAYIARQIGCEQRLFEEYAARDATRREHLAEAMRSGGYIGFDRAAAHSAIAFLTSAAQTIVRPGQLAGILVDELRRRRVLLPSALVLEAIIRGARSRAEQLAHDVLTAGLSAATLEALDGLLDSRPPGKLTWLGWLRNAPQSPAPRSVTKLIDRVEHVRAIGIDRTRADTLPGQVFERLADEAARITT